MGIVEQVSDELKTAMRAKDKPRVSALRGIRAAFIEAMKSDGSDTLSDDTVLPILRRLAKQRVESITAYRAGGREDLVSTEQAELEVIDGFLPSLADEATTRGWVQEAIDQSGASGAGDMGKVMGVLMSAHRADLDGKLANKIVRELLGS